LLVVGDAVQLSPDGLAHAYLNGADFLAGAPAAVALGDNLFHEHDLMPQLAACRCELGWQPCHSFEEGLAATVRWYLEHHSWCGAGRTQGDKAGTGW
jgi:nucleoside-diphosphate-sugar epimerase